FADFFLKGWPCGCEQIILRLGESAGKILFRLVSGPCEDMQFIPRARSRHVQEATQFLRFALIPNAIYPRFRIAAFCAFGLNRRDKKLGDFAEVVPVARIAFGRETSLEPAKHVALTSPSTG